MKYFRTGIAAAIFFSILILQAQPLWANNLTISNVSLESRTATCDRVKVQFDITWSNTWRDGTNYDGAWIFFKVCKNACSEWVHGNMKTAGTNPADTSAGTGTSLTRYVPTDKRGAFLFLSSSATGTVSTTNVELALDFAAAPLSASATDNIQVRVFGIEMVYIPTAAFYLGASYDSEGDPNHFFFDAGDSTNPNAPIYIGSTRPYVSNLSSGDGTDGDITWYPDADSGSLPSSRSQLTASYPYGYSNFWVMKYEVTQGMYRDFLNTLNTAATASRVRVKLNNYFAMTNSSASSSNRNSLKFKSSGTPFVCDLDDDDVGNESVDGEWLAMNLMTWPDCASFADWSGLRPLTEMEWEKAGKGTVSHTPRLDCESGFPYVARPPLSNAGQNSEVAAHTGACHMATYYSAGSLLTGPMRVGFSATSTSTRTTASASYYGAMQMSGNVSEYTVSVGGVGRNFTGTHGDGILSTTASYEGNATNTDWPGIDGTVARGVTGANGSGRRGGGWGEYYYPIAYIEGRTYAADQVILRTDPAISYTGCRVGRTP